MNNSPFMRIDERNNLKSMNFEAWGGLEGFLRDTSNGAGGYGTINLLKRISPFLSRAVDMTANAVANLPFEIISESGDVVDSSADWQNVIGGIDNPERLLYLLTSSLCGGKAYVLPEFANDKIVARLRYLAPHTVLPMITTQGLRWFSRASDYGNAGIYEPIKPAPGNPAPVEPVSRETIARSIDLFYNGPLTDHAKLVDTVDRAQGGQYAGELMYFWLPDSDIEIGPAKKYPIGTALLSAQALSSMDNSLKLLADRNFVPAMLMSAKGMTSQKDREITENWLNRFLRGAYETVAKLINAEAVSMIKVGAGMDDLKAGVYTDIKGKLIEDIGAAFGIPAGIFTSDKAYAQEMDALIRIWYTASEFIAIYHCIEDTFNTQLLDRWNYRLTFRPETIDAFQDDEATRMTAFRDWVSARQRPSIGAQLLGMELPEGVEYSDLDEKFDTPEPVKPVAPNSDPSLPAAEQPEQGAANAGITTQESMTMTPNMQKDIVLWRQVAQKNYRKGKGTAVDFECKFLPDVIADAIRMKLSRADNELDIVKAFEIPAELFGGNGHVSSDSGLKAVADALNKLADMTDVQPAINIHLPSVSMVAQMPRALPPNVKVIMPEAPAPIVNLSVPEQKAPIVNIKQDAPASPTVIVNTPKLKKSKQKVTRDAKGNILGSDTEHTYED